MDVVLHFCMLNRREGLSWKTPGMSLNKSMAHIIYREFLSNSVIVHGNHMHNVSISEKGGVEPPEPPPLQIQCYIMQV